VTLPIYVVDAFASKPFTGNPAGVCPLESAFLDEATMFGIAAEMKHAETAFLVPRPEAANYDLRWFTPTVEVDLCGHATLASAHVLWETGAVDIDQIITFHTKSGPLTAERGEGIQLDFPAEPVEAAPLPRSLSFVNGFVNSGKNRLDWLIEFESEDQVRQLSPNFDEIESMGLRGLVVTAPGRDYDFVSRFFAPQSGIPEDPVTGSAHCGLTPYWSQKLGKNKMRAFQASPRGGEVGVELRGDRALLSGNAITVLRGSFKL
jgi:predicted PhzF superfamily epimerase YddE/YHI9